MPINRGWASKLVEHDMIFGKRAGGLGGPVCRRPPGTCQWLAERRKG